MRLGIRKGGIKPQESPWKFLADGETVADFILGGSKISADGDCGHEIKRHLPLGRNVVTNLDSIL